MNGVVALVLAAAALPALAARAMGGHPPNPRPQLAALAPLAVLPAVTAVAVAATTRWWLALLLAFPAAILLAWQLPPLRRPGQRAAAGRPASGAGRGAFTLRGLTCVTRPTQLPCSAACGGTGWTCWPSRN